MAGRKRSGRGVGSAASSREVNQGQGTALAQLLTDHAVDLDVAQDHVRWIKKRDELPEELRATWGKYVPTVVTRWQSNGHAVDQVRIPEDKRTDDGVKYLFPDKTEPPLNCVRDPGHGPILLVEGTFQHLAAGSYAPAEFAIYGMFGCWGWSGRDLSFVAGRELYLVLDADRARNSDVWDAAKGLKERAEVMGAAKALLVTVPGKAKDGLDDFLATVAEDQRDVVLRRLLDKATPNLGRRPPQKNRKSDRSRWFDENGNLKAEDAAKAVYAKCPMRLTLDKRVAVYRDGVYRPDDEVLMGVVLQLLKNDYKPQHFTTIKQAISGTLALQNKRLPERLDRPWVNVLNGWVDLETGNLIDHDPAAGHQRAAPDHLRSGRDLPHLRCLAPGGGRGPGPGPA
jgi:putative DNA primase/helicase